MSYLKQKYFSLSDENGNIVEEITYDGHYGKVVKHTTKEENFTMNPYGYTSRELDKEDLYYYRARYYDPTIQQFLSPDPIEFEAGDFNFYRYVGGDCVNFRDPSGLFSESETRQKQLEDITKSILDSKCVSSDIKRRLRSVWRQGKLRYILSSSEPTSSWPKSNNYRGYSRDGNLIYITGLLWKTGYLDYNQAVETILHETLHKVWANSRSHPSGFMDRVDNEFDNYFSCEQCF